MNVLIRTADRIREELEQAIVTGEFQDDERLDVVALSRRFGVSRTPVREALHGLSASGLVEHLPRRGAFVRYPSFVTLIEMFDVMAELEAMCGRLAARHATKEKLAAIELALHACETASHGHDSDVYYKENERFHHRLYHASGNGFLADEASRLHKRLQPFRRLQLKVRNRVDQSMAEHHDIFTTIKSGDGALAAELLKAHVAIQGEKFRDLTASYTERPGAFTG